MRENVNYRVKYWRWIMAHTVDNISIRGLRKAHLRQLATYIRERDREGWYYGPREQFERRHADLLKLADRIEAIADDEDARLPNIPRPAVPGSMRRSM